MQTTRTPAEKCPECGDLLDCAMDVTSGHRPSEGSVSICSKCGHLQMFTADLHRREPTEDELRQLRASPEVRLHLAALDHVRMHGGRPRKVGHC